MPVSIQPMAFKGNREQASRTKKSRLEARAALREVLADGSVLYPDSPPGIGWVLMVPGRPKRYLRDRETALKDWQKLTQL